MGKKMQFFISTLMLLTSGASSLLATPSANAEIVIPRDVSYWTFQEIQDFELEHDRLAVEHCGAENRTCQRDFFFEQLDSQQDRRYNLLDHLKNNHFLITDINPTNETVTLYFRDQNMMLWYMGIDNSAILDEVYLAWVEDGVPDPRQDPFLENGRMITSYVSDIRNGTMSEGVHKVFSGTSAENGDGWFTPGVEHQFSIAGSDLASSTNHFLHAVVLSVTGGDMLGGVDYDSCYKFGYDGTGSCQVAFSSDGELLYLPSTLFATRPDPAYDHGETISTGSTDTDVSSETNTDSGVNTNLIEMPTSVIDRESPESITAPAFRVSADTQTTYQANHATNNNSPAEALIGANIGTTADIPEATPTPANTTYVEVPTASNNSCTKVDFPWWIIVLIIAGDVLAVWWFLPSRRK